MLKKILLGSIAVLFLGLIIIFSLDKGFLKSLYSYKNSSTMELKGNMYITSPAFEQSEIIPTKYTCDGENINPPLIIAGIPQESQSLALIVEDPDAPMGTWDHWLVYNINPDVREIKEGQVPPGGIEVVNSFGQKNYGGPCPPPGPAHRYFFKVYALDTKLPENIQTKKELLEAIQNHILTHGELMGLYSR